MHKDIAKRCLNIENQVHEMSEVLEASLSESNNKMMKMKLQLSGVVSTFETKLIWPVSFLSKTHFAYIFQMAEVVRSFRMIDLKKVKPISTGKTKNFLRKSRGRNVRKLSEIQSFMYVFSTSLIM